MEWFSGWLFRFPAKSVFGRGVELLPEERSLRKRRLEPYAETLNPVLAKLVLEAQTTTTRDLVF